MFLESFLHRVRLPQSNLESFNLLDRVHLRLELVLVVGSGPSGGPGFEPRDRRAQRSARLDRVGFLPAEVSDLSLEGVNLCTFPGEFLFETGHLALGGVAASFRRFHLRGGRVLLRLDVCECRGRILSGGFELQGLCEHRLLVRDGDG